MSKRFNDTGLCIPEKHYMADTSSKLTAILTLIEEGSYFAINRPQQYGKTTIAHLLGLELINRADYLALELSFEGIGDVIFEQEATFCTGFINLLIKELTYLKEDTLKNYLQDIKPQITDIAELSESITWICEHTPKKVVLIIDEIDKSSNNQLFLSFLGLLRDKYLRRNRGRDSSFQSVILIGVHDIKTLKLKITGDATGKLNSPWNIAVDFPVDMGFSVEEIRPMLADYVEERGIKMDTTVIAEKIHYYTSGYPFLVSKICKIIDETILPNTGKKQWTIAEVEAAVKAITYVGYTMTLFDSLVKNLENDSELYQMLFDISINGLQYDFYIGAPTIYKAFLLGFIKDKSGICAIRNRIFEQRFYNHFLSKQARTKGLLEIEEDPGIFSKKGLNLELVLQKFQQFIKENYTTQDTQFLEREGRLLFLSFLRPILNGKGFDFKEPVIGEERRIDIVITYLNRRYVIELKRWRGKKYHEAGLQQLSDYLDTYAIKKGYLLIFDFRKTKTYQQKVITFKDKTIFAVWV